MDLVRNSNLNGQSGTVLPLDGNSAVPGTVKVRLDLGPEVAVRPQNLVKVDEAVPASEEEIALQRALAAAMVEAQTTAQAEVAASPPQPL